MLVDLKAVAALSCERPPTVSMTLDHTALTICGDWFRLVYWHSRCEPQTVDGTRNRKNAVVYGIRAGGDNVESTHGRAAGAYLTV